MTTTASALPALNPEADTRSITERVNRLIRDFNGRAVAAWTPTDQSGAGLSFTGVLGNYTQVGSLVTAWGR